MSDNVAVQHIPCIRFNCVKCCMGVSVLKQLSDGKVTYNDCKYCHREYRIHWGNNQDEIQVMPKEGKNE